jgi:wyosine [tRNA(Phe)-imidazoG37] synthetase (radical SAM superfamily)
MKYIFGPVNSRRLGHSLGIDLFSGKTCNLNCIYCEVGATASPVHQRAVYTSTQAIIEEITTFCADLRRLDAVDVLTVTAKGEPTLHRGLGEILGHIKRMTDKPVAVLTNGTTLMHQDVRQELRAADIVIPSLDSARRESFLNIDRPAAGIDLQEVIHGLTVFSHEYLGKLWLEILLVQDVNDSDQDIEALVSVLKLMRLDRIQLNTVVRPPAEPFARPVKPGRLLEIADLFHKELAIPVDLPFTSTDQDTQVYRSVAMKKNHPLSSDAILDEILLMLQRRPCTAADIDRTFQLGGPDKVEQLLEPFVNSGVLQKQAHTNECYYQQSSTIQ